MTSTWAIRTLRVLVPLLGLALVIQYLLGLLTNAYAPAGGFTPASSGNYLDAHYEVGYLLGVLSLLTVVVAAAARRSRALLLALVTFLAVLVAGYEGMRYVATNDPANSVGMGVAFLVAFWSSLMLAASVYRRHPGGMGTRGAPMLDA